MTATFPKGAVVRHAKLGRGRVVMDDGEVVVARFDSGMESCAREDLEVLQDVGTAGEMVPGSPARALTRAFAAAIRSANDTWGVFSNSRIDLLPHQLWVCRKVLERWPARWLVADDVGLGKTIEAGLILTPLLSSGRVRRLLIIAPASLVDQWQERMREMFDIRLARYTTEADGARADFWGTNAMVVASAQTLRMDRNDRRARLAQAEPWDLVVVDEAHHLNNDEKGGATLAWDLLHQLQERRRIVSLVFFTGTPHRGKDYGFVSLLELLRPDLFDAKRPISEQLGHLREVMIRNNKRRVTDMTGCPLFTPVKVDREEYRYSDAERRFYDLLTEYIVSGKAYASQLASAEQRTAFLVLVAMQKLASSSVAAIRRALTGRLARLRNAKADRERAAALRRKLDELRERDDPADADVRAALEEDLAASSGDVLMGPHEVSAIEELLVAAEPIADETKIRHIIGLLRKRFADRSVLLFTEYKATQALVLSALQAEFGDGCAAFINGDGRIDGVISKRGGAETLVLDRREAARRFNTGEVRFLVSTEAAGEGIDLQRQCHSLIHVDLPWNPMRLHQRVGRVDRYGQLHPVEVVSVRNPETVEARIWDCLEEKLARITAAFAAGMDDPEDMLQLVLGMSRGSDIERIFIDAPTNVPRGELASWFDARTATFGGRRAVEVVRELVGNVARFDFGTDAAGLPRADLPDLLPFFRLSLTQHGRKSDVDGDAVTFLAPEEWTKADFAVDERYEGLRFRRGRPGDSGGDVGGVGHRVFDAALRSAEQQTEVLAVIPGLEQPVCVFAVRDAVTTGESVVRTVVVGVRGESGAWSLLQDWELVKALNRCAERPVSLTRASADRQMRLAVAAPEHVAAVTQWLGGKLADLALPFRKPQLDPLLLLVPPREEEKEQGS